MIGRIEEVRDSKSGKTLSAKVGGSWYTTKNWDFKNMVGQEIIFEPSSSEFNGQTMHWINDWQEAAAGTTPAAQAFDERMAQQPTPPPMNEPYPDPAGSGYVQSNAPQTAPPSKDAVIHALAMLKCIEGIKNPDQAWTCFEDLYHKANSWTPAPF